MPKLQGPAKAEQQCVLDTQGRGEQFFDRHDREADDPLLDAWLATNDPTAWLVALARETV